MIWYVSCLAAGSFISNLATFIYTKKTFDTTQSIYYILTLDSGITWMGSLLFLSVYALQEYYSSNPIICSTIWFTLTVQPATFPMMNFLTSFIRYKKIEASMVIKNWLPDKAIIKKANVTVCTCLVFPLIEVTANAVFHLKISAVYSDCMNEENQFINTFVPLILNTIPAIILILITAAYDLKSLQYVREFRRATRVSTISYQGCQRGSGLPEIEC